MTANPPKLLSVVVPAHNEAPGIAHAIEVIVDALASCGMRLEVVIVDDGSHDATRPTVEKMGEENIQLIGHPRNQGKGYALKKGLYHATGEVAFMIDSDMEVWPSELETYFTALESADIVIGSKRHPLSNVRTPTMRKFLSLAFNIIERLLTGVKASDTQAGVKAARSRALYTILPILTVKRYAFDAELLAVATLLGLRIRELPVDIDLKASFSGKEVARMLLDLFGIGYRLRIKKWYQKSFVETRITYKLLALEGTARDSS